MSAPASAIIETTVTVPALIGIPGPQGATGPAGPPGTQEFTVAGNSGAAQTISNGDTLTLTSPVSFQQVVMSANTATFSWPNQSGRVFLASPADGSAGTPAFRAITFADLDAVLGTMAQQDANAVAITGGTIASAAISGGSASGLTSLGVTGNTTLGDASGDTLTVNGTVVDIPNGLSFTTGRIRINSAITTARLVVEETGSTVPAGFFRSSTGAGFEAQSSATDANEGVAKLQCNNALTKGLLIRAAASQAANLQEWRDSSANVLSFIAAGGPATFGSLTSGTNDTLTTLTIRRNSTGTPAANFASRTLWQLESSTTENRDAAAMDVVWTTATDATRTSRMDFYVASSGTLTSVMIVRPTGITPSGNITFDLGSTLQRWANVFAANFVTDNGSNHVLLDGGTNGGMIELITSADTNVATRPTLAMSHRSSGTVAAGFGQALVFQLESSTTNETNAGAIETSWVVATHASRTARVRYLVYDTAEREYMRGEASGSAPMIGFLGANAIVRPTVTGSRGGNAALASLLTEIANLGLIVDNTTA